MLQHDVSTNPTDETLYFKDLDEAKRSSRFINRFSRLADLSSSKFKSKDSKKYEFLLVYPQPLILYAADSFKDMKESEFPFGQALEEPSC